MKCKKSNKNCTPSFLIEGKNNNFICSGICSKPSQYKYDLVWLCLNGELSKRKIEMTFTEALYLINCLSITLSNISSKYKEL